MPCYDEIKHMKALLKSEIKTLQSASYAISYHYFYSSVICSCNLHPTYSVTRVETFHSLFVFK